MGDRMAIEISMPVTQSGNINAADIPLMATAIVVQDDEFLSKYLILMRIAFSRAIIYDSFINVSA